MIMIYTFQIAGKLEKTILLKVTKTGAIHLGGITFLEF